MEKVLNYNVGLDIGTNSVGWAVTDENFDLVKRKRKNLWGVRLFESAETAASRRLSRGQRRRYTRRKERIILLRNLVEDMVLKSDNNFFIRLEESFKHFEDKTEKEKYNLFIKKDYTDEDYFKKYPTIYHLRNELVHNTEKADPRLIYLAMHHIIKYRGNFLYQGQNFSINNLDSIKETIKELLLQIEELYNEQGNIFTDEKVESFLVVLIDTSKDKREKQKELNDLLNVIEFNKKSKEELVKILLGYKGNIDKVFSDESLVDENGKGLQIELSSPNYEEKEEEIAGILGENYLLIESLKKIYSFLVLQGILDNTESISKAMIKKYDKHKSDLEILKRVIKKYYQSQYNKLFRDEDIKAKSYVNYIKGITKCSREDLYKSVKNILLSDSSESEDKEIIYCLEEIEKNNFLNKQNHRDNGAIPYQLNKLELEKIIANQKHFYEELEENKDKIVSLLEFRIPYYVGPLNPNSDFAWIKKISNEKIYPWNFEKVVDKDQTAEGFITRMTNFCSYLPDEKVIPKNSLLYSEFMVKSEIKQIKVNGKFLDKKTRRDLYEDLFKKNINIKEKRLIDWLDVTQFPKNKLTFEAYKITGYQKDKEFASSLKSYHDFTKIFGKINSENKETIETIIYWLTVYEDKEIIKRRLKKELNIEPDKIKKILKLRYTGWSRLSEKLLVGLKTDYIDGTRKNIMELLEETDENFMQIITNKKYSFAEQIKSYSVSFSGEKISYEDIKKLQGSPAIKKGVWQTIKIVEEIAKIMGKDPQHIFMEFAREDQESKRTKSRFNQLKKAYENISLELDFYKKELLKELKNNEENINKEKYYLYFLQNGKSLYSGKKLEISQLGEYEVDHIVPQSFIKDDSFENKALVLREENQAKGDKYPLFPDIQRKNISFWKYLLDNNLMTLKKYNALTRKENFENLYEKGFINRQLVETRQIVKSVANLFEGRFIDSKVVTIKADLVSNFRSQYDIYKLRDINDFHHAKDAYLTSVLGIYLLKRYPKLDNEIIYSDFKKFKEKARKETSKHKNGFIIGSMNNDYINQDTGEIIWKKEESINKIKKIVNYNDCFVTKKLEEGTGQFYNLTLLNKEEAKKTKKDIVPRKKGWDPKKYGGYGSLKQAYFIIVEHSVKGKNKVELLGIPIHKAQEIKNKIITLEDYLSIDCNLKNCKVIKNKIMKNQLIIEGDKPIYLASAGEVHNAKQLKLSKEQEILLYKINKNILNSEEHQKIDNFYMDLEDKISNEYNIFPEVKDLMSRFRETYITLDFSEKKKIIQELLKVTKTNASNANLSSFSLNGKKLSDRIGRKTNYKLKFDNTILITQSITGIFEKRELL